MRTLVCIFLTAAAWQLHAQGEIFAPSGSYAGEIPHRAIAKVIFSASIGEFTNGPVKMELVGKDAETEETILSFRVDAFERGRRIIRAEFPFGGRYVGRYRPGENVIVGHFSHFSRRGDLKIPRRRFQMTHIVAAASPPAN